MWWVPSPMPLLLCLRIPGAWELSGVDGTRRRRRLRTRAFRQCSPADLSACLGRWLAVGPGLGVGGPRRRGHGGTRWCAGWDEAGKSHGHKVTLHCVKLTRHDVN